MIISSVELQNIRSYKVQRLSFDKGITVLCGDIGSGKSSVLQAIEFAFFGLRRGELEGYQLLRKGEQKASVKLSLHHNDETIEIFRSLKKTKEGIAQDNGYISVNSALEELSPQEITAAVFEILKFPKDFLKRDTTLLYRFTTYTPQEQLKDILFTSSDKRLELIRKLFNIDKYKQLSSAVQSYLGVLRASKQEIQLSLKDMSKAKEEAKLQKEKLKELTEERERKVLLQKVLEEKQSKNVEQREKCEERLNNYEKEHRQVEQELRSIEDLEKEARKLQAELERKKNLFEAHKDKDFTKEIESLEIKIKDILRALDANAKVLELLLEEERERKNLEGKREKSLLETLLLEKEKTQLAEKERSFDLVLRKCQIRDMKNSEQKLLAGQKKKEKLLDVLEKIEESKSECRASIERNKVQIESLKAALLELHDKEECPLCQQEISAEHLETFEREKKETLLVLEKDLREKTEKLQILEEEKKTKQALLDILSVQDSQLQKLGFEREALEEKLVEEQRQKEECRNELKKILEKLREKKEELTGLEAVLREKEKKNNEREKKQEEEKSLREGLAKARLLLLDFQNKNKEKVELGAEISKRELELGEKELKIGRKNEWLEKVKELEKKKEALQELKRKIEENREKIVLKQRECDAGLSALREQVFFIEKELQRFEADLKEQLEKEKKLAMVLEDQHLLGDILVPLCDKAEKKLFTSYYLEAVETCEKIFLELIEDKDIELRLDEDFSPVLEQNGYDTDIKNLSGGEKAALAIAYRLMLKKIVEHHFVGHGMLETLILDEPTDGFSSEQIERLGQLLRESSTKQILIVSHDSQIESIAEHCLRIEKTNHKSSVV